MNLTKKCKNCDRNCIKRLNEGNNLWRIRKFCSKGCGTSFRFKKHGMSSSRVYDTWQNIKSRCNNKNNPDYKHYGGRGITYDPKWSTFEGFWGDMRKGYTNDLEIDRINNRKGYTKENCRWTTRKIQLRNYSRNRLLTLNGKTQPLVDWSTEIGMLYSTLNGRINGKKWTVEQALTRPLLNKYELKKYE